MSDNKQVLKKLLKIAENQQKIIRKLAQDMVQPQATPEANPVTSAFAKIETQIKANLAKAFPQMKVNTLSVTSSGQTNKVKVDLTAENVLDAKKVKGVVFDAVLNASSYSLNADPVVVNGQAVI